MGRPRQLLGVCGMVALVVFVAAGPVGTVASDGAPRADDNTPVAQSPGAQFAGGITGEGAALENEHQRRTLNASLKRARTGAARVGVIRRHESTLDKRLDSLEARTARLATDRRTGEIERDQYRAESAVIKTEVSGVGRHIAILRSAFMGLPQSQRGAHSPLRSELSRLAKHAHAIDEDNDDEDVGDDDLDDDDDDDDDDEENGTDDDDRATIRSGSI